MHKNEHDQWQRDGSAMGNTSRHQAANRNRAENYLLRTGGGGEQKQPLDNRP